MKINGLAYTPAQVVKPAQVPLTQSNPSVSMALANGIRPWAELDEETVQPLRYDRAQGASQQAISQYQDVASQLKRQEINQLFGVDLFA